MEITVSTGLGKAILAKVEDGKFRDVESVIAKGLKLIDEEANQTAKLAIEAGWLESEAGLVFNADQAREELDRRRAIRLGHLKAS
jgi:hypothetical protein